MKKIIILLTLLNLVGCTTLFKKEAPVEPLVTASDALEETLEPLKDALEPLNPLTPLSALVDSAKDVLSKGECTTANCDSHEKVKDDPFFAPVEPIEPDMDVVPSGSLFQDSYANNLYSDIKAHRVGDIITVYLEESTSASKQAGTSFDKNNSYSVEIEDITLPSTSENGVTIYGGGGEGTQKSSFSGDSGTDQSNSLKGSITVNVTRVLSNGNLEIRGEKWLMLNNGEEFIRIKGVIRSQDVGADNSISSTHIANSRIQYGGTGDFANTQKQGWLSSYFNKHWPL